MSDLEMARACAEAMGITLSSVPNVNDKWTFETKPVPGQITSRYAAYDPLTDDAQAFALVKRFKLAIWEEGAEWACRLPAPRPSGSRTEISADLNRAIVQCVARIRSGQLEGK